VSTGRSQPSPSSDSPTGGDLAPRQVTPLGDGGDSGVVVGMAVENRAVGSPWPSPSGDARWESSRRYFLHLRQRQRWCGDGGDGGRRC
jgi:hypothetical protein